jgi:hypothetical protein
MTDTLPLPKPRDLFFTKQVTNPLSGILPKKSLTKKDVI